MKAETKSQLVGGRYYLLLSALREVLVIVDDEKRSYPERVGRIDAVVRRALNDVGEGITEGSKRFYPSR